MKSFTLHKLEDDLVEQLEKRAEREGSSVNRTAKNLLRAALGLTKPAEVDHRDDFTDLFGTWSDDEREAIDGRIRDERSVDSKEWER